MGRSAGLARILVATLAAAIAAGSCTLPSGTPGGTKDPDTGGTPGAGGTGGSTTPSLSVTSTTPADKAANVDPGSVISVKFDEDLDFAAVQADPSLVTLTPPLSVPAPSSVDYAYDAGTRILTLTAHPYLVDGQQYTVSLSASLCATSGHTLESAVTWTFTTATGLPAGDVAISSGTLAAGTRYTNADNVTLAITHNIDAVQMRRALSSSALATATWEDLLDLTPSQALDTSTEGTQTVYIQFRSAGGTVSTVRSASIVRDVTAPQVTVTAPPYYNLATVSAGGFQPVVTASDTSGIASYQWQPATDESFDNPAAAEPTITLASDNSYTFTLKVTDRAGNVTTATPAAPTWRDTSAPSAPTILGSPSTTASPSLYPTLKWSWSAVASTNTDGNPDQFRLALDGGTPWTQALAAATYTATGLADGTHQFSVTQVDSAGNPSTTTVSSLVVTSTKPMNGTQLGSAATLVTLEWRDQSVTNYRVHVYKDDAGAWTESTYSIATGMNQKLVGLLAVADDYRWYVEWWNDGNATTNPADGRLPAAGSWATFVHL